MLPANPDPDPDSDLDLDPDPNLDLDPDLYSDPDPDPDPYPGPNPDPDPDPNPDPDPDPDPYPDPNQDSDPDPDPGPNRDLDPDLDLDRTQTVPFSEELGGVERPADDACSLRRRVGPSGPDDLLHLGQNAGQAVVVAGNHGQVPDPLIWAETRTRRSEGRRCRCGCCWTHCRGRSSWRRTGPRRPLGPRTQNGGWPRRPGPGCRTRSPDRPSRRRRTASSSVDRRGRSFTPA